LLTSPSASDSVGERIEQAMQAIMDYNYTATEKSQKWAITPDALVRLSGGDLSSVELLQSITRSL